MNTPQPAAAPDPTATAAAQTASNKATAETQYGLNATNQTTPTGSLTYKQVGTWPDGTPHYEADTTLSAPQQSIFNTTQATQQNLANIGQSESANIGSLLNTPFNLDTATADKLSGIQKEFLDPQWNTQQKALESQNIAKGIAPGSEQYRLANQNFSDQRQRAYDQSYLDSYQTAEQAALTQRDQPINEISALLGQSGVQQPTFQNTPSPGVAPTDVIGAQQQSLNQSNVGYNAQIQQQNALMSGLFGLGGAGLKAAGSVYGA